MEETNKSELQSRIDDLRYQIAEVDKKLVPYLQSERLVEEQKNKTINKMHEYNDMKDVALLLIGKIAELNGLQTADVYKQFDLDLND